MYRWKNTVHWRFCYYCLLSEAIYTQKIRANRVTKASCYTLMKSRLKAHIAVLLWRKAAAASEYLPLLDRQKGIQSYVIFNSLWAAKTFWELCKFWVLPPLPTLWKPQSIEVRDAVSGVCINKPLGLLVFFLCLFFLIENYFVGLMSNICLFLCLPSYPTSWDGFVSWVN